MKKILTLIKKDIYLDRTNLLMVIVLSVGLPVFVGYLLKGDGIGFGKGLISFMLSTMYCLYFAQNKVSALEFKYKGAAYLTLTPYTRTNIVIAKYIFVFLLFLLCIFSYGIADVMFKEVPSLKVTDIIITLFIQITFWSIYLPLEYKLGYNNIKNYFALLFIGMPWVITIVFKYMNAETFKIIESFTHLMIYLFIVLIAIVLISIRVSIKIYNNKNL